MDPHDLLVRTFDVELEAVEGRTLIGRIVPYNTPATVADPPAYEPYREEWLPGVFDRNERAAHRVLLDFEHEAGIRGVIGRGVDLTERSDGAHAAFKVYENADGDKALEMYHDGVLRAFSVSALPIKSVRGPGGVVQRVKAHLDRVALCRKGAFAGAEVLAFRSATIEEPDPVLPLTGLPPELAEHLAGLGVKLPQSYVPPAKAEEPESAEVA